MMKKDYSITALAGSLIWAAAMVLRRLSLPESGIVSHILNVLPKIGMVWLVVGLVATFWPYVTKKPFPANRMHLLIILALLPVVLYKIAYPLVRGVPLHLNVWDFVASVAAAVWLMVGHHISERRTEAHEEGAAAEKGVSVEE